MTASHHIAAVGIDLGGTRLKMMAATADGLVVTSRIATIAGDDWIAKSRAAARGFLADVGEPAAIGVAAPGLASADERSISFLPNRLPGLEGLDWTELTGVSHPVPVLNDAHAALMGEVWAGAARGLQDVLMLTLGTGVGGAAMLGGQLLRGHLGRAGHVGHISLDPTGAPSIVGTPGSLEGALGNHSLAARSNGRFTDTRTLVEAVQGGDAFAAEVWHTMMVKLAAGLTSLINAFDPQRIIIGGGIAECGDLLFDAVAVELDRIEWRPGGHRVEITGATLGDEAGALGAAYYALQKTTAIS